MARAKSLAAGGERVRVHTQHCCTSNVPSRTPKQFMPGPAADALFGTTELEGWTSESTTEKQEGRTQVWHLAGYRLHVDVGVLATHQKSAEECQEWSHLYNSKLSETQAATVTPSLQALRSQAQKLGKKLVVSQTHAVNPPQHQVRT
eukprot:3207284-Rhodomonas_salina.1